MANILILESDKVLAGNLAHFLRRRGHQTAWVAEPQSAIEQADRWQPEVIIADLILGGHGGVEFLFELRSYPEWQDLPVIIYSSLPPNELAAHQAELEQLDATTHFYKPQSSLLEIAAAVDRAAAIKA